jgi:hypothetical protein
MMHETWIDIKNYQIMTIFCVDIACQHPREDTNEQRNKNNETRKGVNEQKNKSNKTKDYTKEKQAKIQNQEKC